MQGQDVALLLKLAIQNAPQVPSKDLAESLFICIPPGKTILSVGF
jgi:hypothetical protein